MSTERKLTDLSVFSELEDELLDILNATKRLNEVDPNPEAVAEIQKKISLSFEFVKQWREKAVQELQKDA